jgi:hypothetical protein
MKFSTKKIILISIIAIVLIVSSFFVGKMFLGSSKFMGMAPSHSGGDSGTQIANKASEDLIVNEARKSSYEPVPTGENNSSKFGLKILKHGFVAMNVQKGDFFKSWNDIIAFTKSMNGKVTNSNYSKEGEYYSGTITVIIPSDQFDNFLKKLSDFGKIDSLNVSSEDRTGEYVDLNSRLKVLESQRDLLLSWLKDAKSVSDMLKIRNELSSVEQQIETIKGRINYISFHTDFSDLHITLSENPQHHENNETENLFKHYWNLIVEAFIYSIAGILIIVVFLLPWLLLGFGIYKLVVKFRSK